jgi:preprotein translocase subunit SecY
MFPATISSLINSSWINKIQESLTPNNWYYYIIFVIMIVFFSYFYTAIQFNPVDLSDNLRKIGGFIPGIRPGNNTSNYINFVITRLTFGGALYLSAVCLLPISIQKILSNQVPFYFGGTGLLIVVSVALETMQQIEGYFINKQYDIMKNPNNIKIRIRSINSIKQT